MTWLTNDRWIKQPAGERFAALLVRPGILRAPGAHNAMAGLLAKRAGFECLMSRARRSRPRWACRTWA